MKIFVVGDHKTGTGPANVTKEYIRCLPKGTLYQKRTSKLGRVPELYFNILRSDIILFSGYSMQNVLGMKFAGKLNKPTAYIVHGAIDHENKINHDENARMSEIEAETLELADLLIAVSEKFCDWMKNEYPQYVHKIDYVTNGIGDIDAAVRKGTVIPLDAEGKSSDTHEGDGPGDLSNTDGKDASSEAPGVCNILSIGGGMPRKMILKICEAVQLLNQSLIPEMNSGGADVISDNKNNNLNTYINHDTAEVSDISESHGRSMDDEHGGVNYPVKLYVIGKDGADTDAINKYPFVVNPGLVSADEKERLFRECGIFIQNSCFETFGLAPVEALCAGMSIMCSRVCGVLDLFPSADEHDIINDYSDANEIAEKIKYIMKHPNREKLLNDINPETMSWEARTAELVSKLEGIKTYKA